MRIIVLQYVGRVRPGSPGTREEGPDRWPQQQQQAAYRLERERGNEAVQTHDNDTTIDADKDGDKRGLLRAVSVLNQHKCNSTAISVLFFSLEEIEHREVGNTMAQMAVPI